LKRRDYTKGQRDGTKGHVLLARLYSTIASSEYILHREMAMIRAAPTGLFSAALIAMTNAPARAETTIRKEIGL
jgi:hypothetical protein